jgi:hypothetical protein
MNIRHVDAKSLDGQRGLISLSVEVPDRAALERIIGRIRGIDGVQQVERARSRPAPSGSAEDPSGEASADGATSRESSPRKGPPRRVTEKAS